MTWKPCSATFTRKTPNSYAKNTAKAMTTTRAPAPTAIAAFELRVSDMSRLYLRREQEARLHQLADARQHAREQRRLVHLEQLGDRRADRAQAQLPVTRADERGETGVERQRALQRAALAQGQHGRVGVAGPVVAFLRDIRRHRQVRARQR